MISQSWWFCWNDFSGGAKCVIKMISGGGKPKLETDTWRGRNACIPWYHGYPYLILWTPFATQKKRKTSQTQRYSQSNRVLLCMVGLPARGKSYITKMLMRYLTSLGRKRSCLQANLPMGISSELIIAGTLLKVFRGCGIYPWRKWLLWGGAGFQWKHSMRAICAGKQAGVIASSLCWAVLYVQGVFDFGVPAVTSELDVA